MIRRFVLGPALLSRHGGNGPTRQSQSRAGAAADVAPPADAPAADARAELAAQFIPAGSRVLDLGGDTALQRLLPIGCSYQAATHRAATAALICDFAAGEFPDPGRRQSDIIVMLGVLEAIADVESFFTHLRFCKQDVILSYQRDRSDRSGRDRAARGFANHLSFYDLALLFDRYGFRIECTAPIERARC